MLFPESSRSRPPGASPVRGSQEMLLFIIMHNGGDDCRNIQADKSFTWRRMNGAGDPFRGP